MPLPPNTEYLGDGLYVNFEHETVHLFAYDGIRIYEEVYLDGHVLAAFQSWLKEKVKHAQN